MKKLSLLVYFTIAVMIVWVGWSLIGSSSPARSQGAVISRVSVGPAGAQGNADSEFPAISADGRYVAFNSRATTLVSGDTNNANDTFLHDRQTGLTSRVSVASNGAQSSGASDGIPTLSADGRYIAFISNGSNLAPGDTNNQPDIFVHDQTTGTTVLVSKAADGSQGTWFATHPDISADGRFVAFVTRSSLVAHDVNGAADVYVHDRDFDEDGIFDEAGQISTRLVSIAADGSGANFGVAYYQIAISADGRHISFDSISSNLVPGDTNNVQDTFVHDRDSDADGIFDEAGAINTIVMSVADDGTLANNFSYDSDISGDGRYVAFWSQASNLLPNDLPNCGTLNCFDVFVRDRDTDGDGIFDEAGATAISKVSVASDGTPGNGHSYHPAVSHDGTAIAFYSLATNFVPGDTEPTDIFVHSLVNGTTTRVSVTYQLQPPNGASFFPAISGNGQQVAFYSHASNLVLGDTNFRADVFVYDQSGTPPTATPTITPTPSATATATATPTFTPSPTVSPTPTQPPSPEPTIGWQRQTLDVYGDTGRFIGLDLDSSDFPHISYRSEELYIGSLKYMRWDGVAWQVETVDESADVGQFSDLALNTNDRPWISYQDEDQAALKYARWTGTAWEVGVAHPGPSVGFNTTIAISPLTNLVHILHNNVFSGELIHTRRAAGEWQHTVVATGVGTGGRNDLAYDSNGFLRASYYNATTRSLHYASWNGSSWTTTSVDSVGDVGSSSSLAFDGNNQPLISYYDADQDALKLATFDGSIWHANIVNDLNRGGQDSAIGLDSTGKILISYFDGANLALAEQNGAIFTVRSLDDGGNVGLYGRLAIDSSDELHVAYHDSFYRDLRYLTWGPRWEFRGAGAGGDAQRPALAFAGANPGISFFNGAPNPAELDLVAWGADAWQSQTLLTIPGTGGASDLAYGSDGQPHHAASNGLVLSYRRWDGAAWQGVVVDVLTTGNYGPKVVLLLDGANNPTVVYSVDDGLSHHLQLARWDGTTWQITVNGVSPPLAAIAEWDAALSPQDQIYISYYDQGSGDLRLASWDGSAWSDELVDDGNGANTGRFNAIAVDLRSLNGLLFDQVTIAYHDVTNRNVNYAHRGLIWQTQTAVFNTGPLGSLDLVLGNSSWLKPYIAYTALDDNSLRLAFSDDGLASFNLDIIQQNGAAAPADVSIDFDFAPRIAYRDENGFLTYAFPGSRHHVGAAPAHQGRPIGALLGFDGDGCISISKAPKLPAPSGRAGATAISDAQLFAQFETLFGRTPAGRHYRDLYLTHVDELARITFSDPALARDAYRTLHNLTPGLRAWVNNEGDGVIFSQDLADQTLDIWQRIAGQASPELAAVIKNELAASNNMQSFVGGSFDDWSAQIGVPAPGSSLYLPVQGSGPSHGSAPAATAEPLLGPARAALLPKRPGLA